MAMKMTSFMMIWWSCCLMKRVVYNNPFRIEHEGLYYSGQCSERNNARMISIHPPYQETNMSVNVGGRVLSTFNLARKDGEMSVNMYPEAYNPSLLEVQGEVKMNIFCEFSYPITVAGGSDSYQCSLSYKDKSGQHHSIGKCPLTLQYKSSLCLVTGSIDKARLRDPRKVKVFASIYHCNLQCSRNSDLDWKVIVHSSLILNLVSFDHIIWTKSFYKPSLDVGILIGIPKNPINKSTVFEIPLKLKKSETNNKIKYFGFQVILNQHVSIEEVIPYGCFRALEPKNFEEKNITVTEIEITKDEKGQCSKEDPDLLCILLISVKDEVNHLNMNIKIEDMIFVTKLTYGSHDKDIEQHSITIPLFRGRNNIIPVIKNPIILPTFERLNNVFTPKPDDIRIYYIYDEIKFMDVSLKVKCRPFQKSKLQCPSNMLPLKPVLTSVEYSEASKWSLELLIDDAFVVITLEPLSQPSNNWNLSFADSVLNLISGWRAPYRKHDSSLIMEVKCKPIYQLAIINIYKTMLFYNKESNKSMELVVDLSEKLNRSNIRVSNNKANIVSMEKVFIIQGTDYGNLGVELVSKDEEVLVKSYMTVFNEPVSVTDLEISCISDINIIKKVIFSSSVITIADFTFNFQSLNNSQKCFFIIDVIFSDKIKTNIIWFPKDQYSLRFVTNTKIIEVFDLEGMWYTSEKFDNQNTFYIELQESKFCDNPKTILKKSVSLNVTGLYSSTSSSTTTEHNNYNTSQSIHKSLLFTKDSTPNVKVDFVDTKSLKWIIFILIGVVILALIIIVTNIVLKYRNKKSLFRNRREKSLNVIEVHNTLPRNKDYPPLLPPPGPQVQLSDSSAVTISSPHSFWCGEPKKNKTLTQANSFVRQGSLPVKGCSTRGYNEIAPCPPLRWANKMINGTSTNSYNSQEGLNIDNSQDLPSFSPMTWSVTHDVDESSGVGSLNTNIDDIIKDPYGSKERYHKLLELPSSKPKKECIYDMV